MTTESLLNDIYRDVCTDDYCSVCFRTCKERRLLNGINLTKFKYYRHSNELEIRENASKFCDQKICYMCNAQATAANRFCLAVNLSHHINNLFHKMRRLPKFATQVIDHLNGAPNESELKHNHRNVEDLQRMLEQLRRNTTLLQTETLLLNNPEDECTAEPWNAASGRESLRDLLVFEPPSGLDDTLFDLDVSELHKQIIIEDDDPIKEEPPDQNMFIIPDKLSSTQTDMQTDTQTDNATGYILHPILVHNGTITVPTLDTNISINDTNLSVNGLANDTNNISSLNQFLVTSVSQSTSKTQIVATNSNSTNLNFIQNTNSLAKNIVSLVKNPTSDQKTSNFLQNNTNLRQNILNFSQNTVTSTLKTNIIQPTSSVVENVPNSTPKPAVVKKVIASPVKRSDSDSDSDTNCQNIQPIRKAEGKIDWEDKIPMDVISFVSPSDPLTMSAKRQKVTSDVSGFVAGADRGHMDKCVITDVKSVSEYDFIDLC